MDDGVVHLTPMEEGYLAGLDGNQLSDCLYPDDTRERDLWVKGWSKAVGTSPDDEG